MGHTVNFRTHKESYKDKRAVVHAPEDWLIFEDLLPMAMKRTPNLRKRTSV